MFWKELAKVKGGKGKSCSEMRERTKMLTLGEPDVRETWKEYFDDLYNMKRL